MSEVILVAQIRAKKGKHEELKRELTKLILQTQTEEECKQFDLHQATEDLHLFILWEYFANQAAFDTHMKQSYTKAYFEMVKPTLTESTSSIQLNKVLKP